VKFVLKVYVKYFDKIQIMIKSDQKNKSLHENQPTCLANLVTSTAMFSVDINR
jgi:hypothetical protein